MAGGYHKRRRKTGVFQQAHCPLFPLFDQDRALYPIEVKKTATPRPDLARPFKALTRLRRPVAEGGALPNVPTRLPGPRSAARAHCSTKEAIRTPR